MSVQRYTASADTTITNTFKDDLITRATGSNMGVSSVMETFVIYGQTSSSAAGNSTELSRALIDFPISSIAADRAAATIPVSGSVNFFLRIFNAKHAYTLPRNFTMTVSAVSRSWEEGSGIDMDTYKDLTRDGEGANWQRASEAAAWTAAGGDYHAAAYSPGTTMPTYTVSFDKGTEDIEVDVTSMVEEWLIGTHSHRTNYGIGLAMSANLEAATRSYYTKKFFGRSTEFYFKRPYIEARWDSAKKDDRGNFYDSGSLASATDNLNTLYLYNYMRGQLRNIPGIGTGAIYVQVYTAAAAGTAITPTPQNPVTGGHVSTGIYSASFALDTTAFSETTVYDRWLGSGLTVCYHTGTVDVKTLVASQANISTEYTTTIVNLKPAYSKNETARFRLYTREKDWNPTIYTVANTTVQNVTVESGSYRVFRVSDNLDVLPFGTGSTLHTQLSFDITGSYFDLNMSMFEPDYAYGIQLAYYNGSLGGWIEQPEIFKFRVE